MATTLLAAITTAVVVVALVTVSGGSADEQPGIHVAVTSTGFDFRAIYLLKEYLATLSIPDIHGKAKVKILFFSVKIDYTISDLKLYNVEIPKCSIDTGTSGLTLTTTEIRVGFKYIQKYLSNLKYFRNLCKYKYKYFFPF